MAAQQFDQIYTETGDELKKATTKQDFVNLLGAVEGKLGGVKETTKNGWNVNFQPSGTFVVLGFKTQFEKGAGEETFTYRISDRDALLVGYRINSNTLITN
jgi:hypothetical protein